MSIVIEIYRYKITSTTGKWMFKYVNDYFSSYYKSCFIIYWKFEYNLENNIILK